ncbi:MAG: ATP-binding protein [Bacillota bacterium]
MVNGVFKKGACLSSKKEFVLYGLDDFDRIQRETALFLEGFIEDFDLHLILSESLTNAFIHGNRRDASKPIYLRVALDNEQIMFEIEDACPGLSEFSIPEECSAENILEEGGRGLVLLSSFCDCVEFKDNKLSIIKKKCPF